MDTHKLDSLSIKPPKNRHYWWMLLCVAICVVPFIGTVAAANASQCHQVCMCTNDGPGAHGTTCRVVEG